MNVYLHGLARNDDEKRLIARCSELVQKAGQGLAGTSDFLDLRQQELARAVAVNATATGWQLHGGYPEAERQRLIVYPEWEMAPDARIACLRISHSDFQAGSIGHRDYLGAILNLGIKREKLGDIVLRETDAYLFADLGLADFIAQQLQRVKHSSVTVTLINPDDFIFQPAELKTIKASLASLRLDASIAAAFNLSRSDVDALIAAGQVKLNQMEIYKCAAPVKAGDLISVRGQGRFYLDKIGGISRKGRYQVEIGRW